MRLNSVLCSTVAVFAATVLPVSAHEQRAATADVTANPRSGQIEIVTRFSLHDAEHALQLTGMNGDDIHLSEDMRIGFATYVLDHLVLSDEQGPLALSHIGQEIEGRNLYVYFEAGLQKPKSLTASFTALQDVWADQTNLMNIELDQCVRSLVFTKDAATQTLALGDDIPCEN